MPRLMRNKFTGAIFAYKEDQIKTSDHLEEVKETKVPVPVKIVQKQKEVKATTESTKEDDSGNDKTGTYEFVYSMSRIELNKLIKSSNLGITDEVINGHIKNLREAVVNSMKE